jgi:hypothetical protein
MEYKDFEDELYYLLDLYDIEADNDRDKNRNDALRLLLEVKSTRATQTITDQKIINVYDKKGIEGIKKMFKRNVCYFYSTDFCYRILFYHYKNNWKEIELLINNKLNERNI